jgi:hypothetical protein
MLSQNTRYFLGLEKKKINLFNLGGKQPHTPHILSIGISVAILNASVASCRLGGLVREADVETSTVKAFSIVSFDSTVQRQYPASYDLGLFWRDAHTLSPDQPSYFSSGRYTWCHFSLTAQLKAGGALLCI